jgi:hypothetical protein
MRSNLGWPPATFWDSKSSVALSTCSSAGASDQLYFVSDSSKGKSTGSGHHLVWKGHYNLVFVQMRSNWGWPSATLLTAISYLALFTCASAGASDQLYFVWDGSKDKSTCSGHHLVWKGHYNLVFVQMRSNLGWPSATFGDSKSSVALSTSASAGASDQLYFVWDSSKRKLTAIYHHLV